MPAQIGGHRRGRLKERGEQIPVGLEQRIFRVEDVEMDGAVVSVDGGLDGVANVVDRADAVQIDAFRVRMHARRHVAIDDPDQAAVVGENEVGVGVPG